MKYLLPVFLLFCLTTQAQESKKFTIEGAIKKTLTVDMASLAQFKTIKLDSITIYNHLMLRKSSIKNIKGIQLKDILNQVEIDEVSPKKLSEYYLVCTATDGYKVVFSWNEVYNSKAESNILILTSFDASPAKEVKGNIAMITTTDAATGRRFVKGLKKITILKAN